MKKIPKAEATIIDDANGKPKKNKNNRNKKIQKQYCNTQNLYKNVSNFSS